MRKFNSKHIDDMELSDFLVLDFNRILYEDFNQRLKSYVNESSLSFFKYIYRDAAFFFPNYNKTPYEVDQYFDNKYSREGRGLNYLIKREIIFDIIQMVTTPFIFNQAENKYIPTYSDAFISGENLSFLYKPYFRLHEPYEGHWHIEHFVDAKCQYRQDKRFHSEINLINQIKDFLKSIDVSHKKEGEISQFKFHNLHTTNYFPKTNRITVELSELGLKKTKELYGVKNLKNLLNEVFGQEYKYYLQKDQYFPGCSLTVYEKTYHGRFEDYKLIYPDADEFDFLQKEEAIISKIIEMDNENKENFYPFFHNLLEDPHQRNFKLSSKKTRDKFIDKRIIELGHFLSLPGISIEDVLTDIGYQSVPREAWQPTRSPNAKEDLNKEIINKSDSNSEFPTTVNNTSNTQETGQLSLKWNDKEFSKLTSIYNDLEENGYVNCGLVNFKKLFIATTDFTPVEWLKEKRALSYFYGLIIQTELIKKPRPMWGKLPSLFTSSEEINPDSAKTEWYRGNKDEGNSELFNFMKSIIDRA